jgi:hypothetical protein
MTGNPFTGFLTGFRNPVRALATAVEAMGSTIDRESFDKMAELRGDCAETALAKGFVVRGYEDLQRLCELGNVCIYQGGNGEVICCAPEDLASRVDMETGLAR